MAIRPAQSAIFQRLPGAGTVEPFAVELVLYHDVLCSWCYVADARLDYLRDEYGGVAEWHLRPYALREQEVNDAVEEAEGVGIRRVPARVIGGEWLMQGCRELSEYRQVIDKYLRERVAPAQVRMMH